MYQITAKSIENASQKLEIPLAEKFSDLIGETFSSYKDFRLQLDLRTSDLKTHQKQILLEEIEKDNLLDIQIKRAQLNKTLKETKSIGVIKKYDLVVKTLTIISGLIIGVIGGITGWIKYEDALSIEKKAKSEVEKLKKEIKTSQQAITSYNLEIKNLEDELNKNTTELKALEASIALQSKDKQEIIEQTNKLQSQKLTLQDDKKKVEENLKELEKEKEILEQQILSYRETLETLDKEKAVDKELSMLVNYVPTNRVTRKTNKAIYTIELTISSSSVDEIASVSYLFTEGLKNTNKLTNKQEAFFYSFSAHRTFTVTAVIYMKDGEVYQTNKVVNFPPQD